MANRYRTHTCAALTLGHVGQMVKLAGWVYRKRDHGGVLFVDLRDHYGLTQLVFTRTSPTLPIADGTHLQSVICITGHVLARTPENVNPALPTGTIEVEVDELEVVMQADLLPFQIADATTEVAEETRLKYRFLDLRRERLHQNVVLRSQVIASLRRRMIDQGFMEMQTPILTSTSPEGARDYLVPSRVHPGKFYALPQAPQQFKQLLMVAGFDRYFQIAPCFRDEDARADRSPGEFYQLDFEMSFVEQDDVFTAIEPVLHGVFTEFSKSTSTTPPFPRIAYRDALAQYGSDKPDLRNPLKFVDVSTLFAGSGFALFANAVANGQTVRALVAPNSASKPRSFFDKVVELGRSVGLGGVAYLTFGDSPKGPLAKYLDAAAQSQLAATTGAKPGDVVFLIAEHERKLAKPTHEIRAYLGRELDLIEKDAYRFVWVVDFPFYERDEETGKIDFSHNPFSMPQGGLEALNTLDPLSIVAYQFDIVCNGVELSSGAIRNHDPAIMLRAFALAGYNAEHVEHKFGGLLNAFRYGAPPHGGAAPGIDRMVMLLAGEANIREVISFPMTQKAEDLLMGAPSPATPQQLQELHIRLVVPEDEKKKLQQPH